MQRHQFLTAVVFAFTSLGLSAWAAAPKKKPAKPDAALPTVERVLRAEVAGQVDRRGQLTETLKEQPDSAAARWQAGFINDGDAWRSFDVQSADLKAVDRLGSYRARRDESPQTCRGHLELAKWCRSQGLQEQERAHLSAALSVAAEAERPPLLKRLNYHQIGGQWISREQLIGWQQLNRRIEAAIQKWGPRLEKIGAKVDGSPRQHDAAVTSVAKLPNPDVIPAIQYVLSGRDEACAQVAADALASMESFEATLALAQSALFSPWSDIRQQAQNRLAIRRLDDFVPALIDLLASRMTGRVESTQLVVMLDRPYEPNAYSRAQLVLLVSYVITCEVDDQFQVARFQSVDYRLNTLLRNYMLSIDHGLAAVQLFGTEGLKSDLLTARLNNDFARDDETSARVREKVIEESNQRTDELNARVIKVLAGATNHPADPDPATWWKWWADFSDVQWVSDKPVFVVAEDSEIKGDPTRTLPRTSCFAAGTPVWTESGPQAIETIKIGDRVLSQEIESGELTYKPVLQTTIRPPKELMTLRFGDETIVCTGGHRFWESGSGWIKARDLAPQTLLHTVTGNTPVWTAKKGETAETYNLVVANFHTYFVGRAGVLCQDVLPPRRANSLVPGLMRTNSLAESKK